jgi:hypothetical protein
MEQALRRPVKAKLGTSPKQPIAPKFRKNSELVRYIDEIYRLSDRRPAAAAYLPDPPSDAPHKQYMSVNSLEVETLQVIADYHRIRAQNNVGKVALCAHTVGRYNMVAGNCGVSIRRDYDSESWKFQDRNGLQDAYKHHIRHDVLKSYSHCGVEFVRALKTHNEAKFARRMADRRFHLL